MLRHSFGGRVGIYRFLRSPPNPRMLPSLFIKNCGISLMRGGNETSGRQCVFEIYIFCNFVFRHVWLSWGKRMAVQHDSYLCKEYRGSIGFPTKRQMVPNNFVAAVVKDNAMLDKRCPAPCRRYVEWEHC